MTVASVDDKSWPAPEAISNGLPPVPAFPEVLMPEGLRPWMLDVSERFQCPPDFIAATAMVAAGAVVGRACGVSPKKFDDWYEPPNLWCALVAPPGLMKSPAIAAALGPVKALAAKAQERHEAALEGVRFAEKVLKARQAKAERGLADATPDELVKAKAILQETVPSPAVRCLMINDATIEKLGMLLADPVNQRGLMYFRDELAGLFASMSRDGHEGDRAFLTEAWSGKGDYRFDRVGRGTVYIPAVCISVLGTIQPEPLAYHLRAALRGGQAADGFMQRFQVTVYPDVPGWKDIDRLPDPRAREQAFGVFERLADLEVEPTGPYAPIPTLRFDEPAQELFTAWRSELEKRVRAGAEHPAFVSHLSKYRKLVPALALLGHLIDDGGPAISQVATERALAWADFLEAHARRLYASVTMADEIAALTLMSKIRSGAAKSPIVARDIHRKCWSGLSSPDDVDGALSVLEAHGYVRRYEVPTAGRPRVQFDVHPTIRPEASS